MLRRSALSTGLLLFSAWAVSMPANLAWSQQSESKPDLKSLGDAISSAVAARSELGGAKVGVVVNRAAPPKTLYELNGDQAFNVASNTKLVTAAAALALLGPGFRMRTEVLGALPDEKGKVTGNLYVRGRGNPSLGQEDLVLLAEDLYTLGVRRVTGGLVIDQSYFDGIDLPPHFDEQKDEHASFRAPIAATSFNFNAFEIWVRPAETDKGSTTIQITPPGDYIRVRNEIESVSRGRARYSMDTVEKAGHLELSFKGKIRAGTRDRRTRQRAPDPSAFIASTFTAVLKRRGIRLGGVLKKSGAIPNESELLAVHHSPPLSVLVRGMGKYSNNYVAEMLLKVIGAEVMAAGAPATWDHGLTAVRDYLQSKLGFAPKSYRYENGSGLFDSSSFTPRHMTKLLEVAARDFSWGPDLLASLSISAVDGTLSNRMIGSNAAGQVRAKTGTLAEVCALSGFVATGGAAPAVFSILINEVPRGKISSARRLQDSIAAIVVRYLQSENAP